MEEKKNKNMVVIIIILCLLLVGAVGFIVYDKVFIESKNNINTQSNGNIENKPVEEEKKLVVSENEVKKIYNNIFNKNNQNKIIVDDFSSDGGFSTLHKFYTEKKIIAKNDISYSDLMVIAYNNIPDNKIKKNNQILSSGSVKNTYEFKIDDMKQAYNSYFGQNSDWKDFEAGYPLGKCKIVGENYSCNFEGTFGDLISGVQFLTVYDKYDTDNENLYVYEKAIYFNSEENKFYTKYDNINGFSNEVSSLDGKDKNVLLDSNYKDSFLTYKHTFKKDSNKNFYLYSVELLK